MVTGRKRNLGWLQWMIGVILVCVAISVVIAVKVNYFDNQGSVDGGADANTTTGDVEEGAKKPEKNDSNQVEEVMKQDVKQYDGESPNVAEVLTGVITHATVSGEKLVVRVNIDQYLESGTCTLSVKQGENAVYKDVARIVNSAVTATCEGFDVPVAGLSNGEVQIAIDLESGDRTGKISGAVQI